MSEIEVYIHSLRTENSEAIYYECLKKLESLLTALLMNPNIYKYRYIDKTNRFIKNTLLQCKGILLLLNYIGYKETSLSKLQLPNCKLINAKHALSAIRSIHSNSNNDNTSNGNLVLEALSSYYQGTTSSGWPEGHGKYTFSTGVIYEGEFHRGEFHGVGTLIYPNGGRYTGRWENGRVLDGDYTFSDGLQYKQTNWEYLNTDDRRYYSEK